MTLKQIIDGIHGTGGMSGGTADEVYYMFIAAFQKSGKTFEEIADSIVNASVDTTSPAESMFGVDLKTQYSLSTADVLWLAHIALVDGPPSATLLEELKMNSTYTSSFKVDDTGPRNTGPKRVTTISMKVAAPTKQQKAKMGFTVVAQSTNCGW